MANPLVLPKAMKLYAPFCPEGREFQRGEEWPGDAWSANPEGKSAEVGNQLAEAQKDLIKAHDEIERLEKVLASKDHDLAVMGRTRDEAVAEAAGMKQALLDAKRLQAEAEAVARDVTAERDRARQDAETLRQRLASAEKPAAQARRAA